MRSYRRAALSPVPSLTAGPFSFIQDGKIVSVEKTPHADRRCLGSMQSIVKSSRFALLLNHRSAFVSVLVASAASIHVRICGVAIRKTAETAQVALRYGYTISAEDRSWLSYEPR